MSAPASPAGRHHGANFEVVVGQSIAQDRDSRYFGLVQSIDDKPKRRLHEILREQGLQMNQDITFLTDGGDTVRNLAADMSPCAEHVLDWFHLTMRLTVLGQYAKGLAHHDEEQAQAAARELKRIKGYLWNGNHRDALTCIDGLLDDLEELTTTYPGIKAFRKGVDEFRTYIRRNADTIPNYAERYRYGERGVRGTHHPRYIATRTSRFIPARAGNTRCRLRGRAIRPVHPRACGEHIIADSHAALDSGSSPRVRGTRDLGC